MAAAPPTVPVLSISDDFEDAHSSGNRRMMRRRNPSYRAIFSDEAAEGGEQHFLESCFLCRRMLDGNRDIFMYRGDTPFCSEECRQEQIEIDEASQKRRSWKTLSPAAASVNNGGQQQQEMRVRVRVRAGSTLVAG